MTDWDEWLACDVDGALKGEPCLTLSSGGPEALPPRYADVPHSCRKRSRSTATTPQPARKATPQTRSARTANPANRQVKRTATAVASWQAVADRQAGRRNA